MQTTTMVCCWVEGSVSIAIVENNAYDRLLGIVKENMRIFYSGPRTFIAEEKHQKLCFNDRTRLGATNELTTPCARHVHQARRLSATPEESMTLSACMRHSDQRGVTWSSEAKANVWHAQPWQARGKSA